MVKLDQWFASSKTCHCCGHKMPEMPLNKRIWQCPECGVEHDTRYQCSHRYPAEGHTGITGGGSRRLCSWRPA
ncbi:transposase [Salmonella enterica]|nr:transposase [Salmonella enterica]EAZ0444288.1 transposase [Salmonella enterica]EAZ0476633.1 transposase [Salmonella enterica]EBF4967522.1 transposase [Salmonella enterica]EBQ5308676.1 transposase [Salmonella enterica]